MTRFRLATTSAPPLHALQGVAALAIGACIPALDAANKTTFPASTSTVDTVDVYCRSEDGHLLRVVLPPPGQEIDFECDSREIVLVTTRTEVQPPPPPDAAPDQQPKAIILSGIAIDDVAEGNGDKDADYGETVKLVVYLQNVDPRSKHTVTLLATSKSPHEFVISGRRHRFELEPGEVVEATFSLGIWPVDLGANPEVPVMATVRDADGSELLAEPLPLRLNERPPPPQVESVSEGPREELGSGP